jgi:hypothetical protein
VADKTAGHRREVRPWHAPKAGTSRPGRRAPGPQNEGPNQVLRSPLHEAARRQLSLDAVGQRTRTSNILLTSRAGRRRTVLEGDPIRRHSWQLSAAVVGRLWNLPEPTGTGVYVFKTVEGSVPFLGGFDARPSPAIPKRKRPRGSSSPSGDVTGGRDLEDAVRSEADTVIDQTHLCDPGSGRSCLGCSNLRSGRRSPDPTLARSRLPAPDPDWPLARSWHVRCASASAPDSLACEIMTTRR